MGLQILRDIAALQTTPFVKIMVDKTTDTSNTERFAIFTSDLQVYIKIFWIILCPIDRCSYATFCDQRHIRKNKLQFWKSSWSMLQHGASAKSVCRSGVAKLINDIEPMAIFTHCYGYALNLAASDTIKKSKVMKNALEVIHEITKLIFSTQRSYFSRSKARYARLWTRYQSPLSNRMDYESWCSY